MTLKFIDLEPYIGKQDHVFNDIVSEIINYPHALESGYFDVKSEFEGVGSKAVFSPKFKYMDYQAWGGKWGIHDRRITLIKDTERRGVYFPGKPWAQSEPHFAKTWGYLRSLPIEIFYRTLIIIGTPNNELPTHQDWMMAGAQSPWDNHLAHTLFINPLNNRSFYYMDNGRRVYTNTSAFLFDQRTPHGITSDPGPGFLLRIYCKLEDEFCDKAGIYRAHPPRTVGGNNNHDNHEQFSQHSS